MELAVTFGSVGDIIQLCQLAIRLSRAIGVGVNAVGESAIEYQELREELNTLVRILMQVVATYEQYESSPYLDGLDHVAKNVVEQCFGYIKEALEHFQRRYQTSLHPGGSGSRIRDVFKKVEWTREHDRIKALRGRLRDGIQRLSLIGNLVAEKTALVDQATLLARIDEVQEVVAQQSYDQTKILNLLKVEREASRHHTRRLEEVKAKLIAQNEKLTEQSEQLAEAKQQLVVQHEQGRTIYAVAKDALSGILEVRTLLVQVSQNVINLHAFVTNADVGRALDPTRELPVMLEDALGRQMPIPAAWLETIQWDSLSMLLNDYFAGQKGHDMVKRRAYTLEESVSGKDLDHSRPLHLSLRRGMTVQMSMVFDDHKMANTSTCPRCGANIIFNKGTAVYCYTVGCGMWVRQDKTTRTSGSISIVHISYLANGQKKDWPLSASNSAANPSEPSDFQRVRLRQNKVHDQLQWYCRTCKCAAVSCHVISLVHELVSLPADAHEGSEEKKSLIRAAMMKGTLQTALEKWEREGDGISGWGSDTLFEYHDVEWVPEQQPLEFLGSVEKR